MLKAFFNFWDQFRRTGASIE